MRGVRCACFVASITFLLCVVAAPPVLPQGPLDGLIEKEEDLPRPPGVLPRPELPPPPEQLAEPGVLLGEGFLAKHAFFEDTALGAVTDIRSGELDPVAGAEIGIAGTAGAVFVDEKGAVRSHVAYRTRTAHVDIVDVEGDGVCEFVNRGSWGEDASLIRHDGRVLWTYGGTPGVNDMAAGDVDGDGKLEFVVGFNGGGGIHLLDANGELIWSQRDSNVWQVETADIDGRPGLEILHSNSSMRLFVRDAGGDLLVQAQPDVACGDFSLCSWPAQRDRPLVIAPDDSALWLLTWGGATVMRLEAPGCARPLQAWAVPVALHAGEPPGLAVIASWRPWQRSVLYVYEPSGGLVYQEVFEGTYQAIAAQRLVDENADTLLLGGEGQVWAYRP